MLGFFKRRRNEARKAEATRLGTELMENVNARIDLWRAEQLETRREMMAAMFDERVVTLQPEDGVTLEEMLEIEAMALLQNWHANVNDYAKEAMGYLSNEDIEFLDLIGAGDRFTEVLQEKIDEVGINLSAHLQDTIDEEMKRRAR